MKVTKKLLCNHDNWYKCNSGLARCSKCYIYKREQWDDMTAMEQEWHNTPDKPGEKTIYRQFHILGFVLYEWISARKVPQ